MGPHSTIQSKRRNATTGTGKPKSNSRESTGELPVAAPGHISSDRREARRPNRVRWSRATIDPLFTDAHVTGIPESGLRDQPAPATSKIASSPRRRYADGDIRRPSSDVAGTVRLEITRFQRTEPQISDLAPAHLDAPASNSRNLRRGLCIAKAVLSSLLSNEDRASSRLKIAASLDAVGDAHVSSSFRQGY